MLYVKPWLAAAWDQDGCRSAPADSELSPLIKSQCSRRQHFRGAQLFSSMLSQIAQKVEEDKVAFSASKANRCSILGSLSMRGWWKCLPESCVVIASVGESVIDCRNVFNKSSQNFRVIKSRHSFSTDKPVTAELVQKKIEVCLYP